LNRLKKVCIRHFFCFSCKLTNKLAGIVRDLQVNIYNLYHQAIKNPLMIV
jgi:hypothetical protein